MAAITLDLKFNFQLIKSRPIRTPVIMTYTCMVRNLFFCNLYNAV